MSDDPGAIDQEDTRPETLPEIAFDAWIALDPSIAAVGLIAGIVVRSASRSPPAEPAAVQSMLNQALTWAS